MRKHYGFDVGDAESAVAVTYEGTGSEPEILPVEGAKSFISAFAVTRSGDTIIGENACYSPRAAEVKLRFKSHFLTDRASRNDMLRFSKGVLNSLYNEEQLNNRDESTFYIGCPAGWDAEAREDYRAIFERAGYPPVKVITESRAALMSACRSKHLQVGYDVMSKPMLVVDVGSSTTDFAYILAGKEVELKTSGETMLGGGVMDEILLDECVAESAKAEKLREIFAESSPWRSYCEFAARRLKEKYFSDEEFWVGRDCAQSLVVRYGLPIKLTLRLDVDTAQKLLNKKVARLDGRSFMQTFNDALDDIKKHTSDAPPQILFLTGGVSKMRAVKQACRGAFPDAVVVSSAAPEFSVARGLAWTSEVDEDVKQFRREIEQLRDSDIVESIVKENIDSLFRDVVDTLVEPILENAAVPVLLRWRNGGIKTVNEIDGELTEAIEQYLKTDEVRELLSEPVSRWIKPVSAQLEEKTIPICVRHGVPYTALSLASYFELDGVELGVSAKNVFAVEQISWMINAIISVVVGLLCGGGGIAIIAGGLPGIIAGVAISMLALFLGKNMMQDAVLSSDIPMFLRRMIPKKFFSSRIGQIKEKVSETLFENLSREQNNRILGGLVGEISTEIEGCLMHMAEVVEIPLS